MQALAKLLLLAALTSTLAVAQSGFVVWKSSDLKRKDAAEELSKTGEYRMVLVHREKDGDTDLHQGVAELLIVETGQATLVVGDERKELAEGDVAYIPATLPYQILVPAGKSVTYLAVRHREDSDDDATAASPIDPQGKKPDLGVELGSGYRACVAGDRSPAGTVVDGYRKVIGKSLMGQSCLWSREPEEAAAEPAKPKQKPQLGIDMGDGFRSCVRGDDSPSGTIVDGYRKALNATPFGVSCGWEKIK
jgi:mannose-6-phosphate isomerase-like protein (cupin superfamily)